MDTKQLIETVTKARRGDTAALQELYLDMYKSVFYLALRIVKNPEDAEDITQEVYITVQQKIAELRETSAFYGWVNQITVNQCNALLRKYKGMARLDDEDEIINLIDDDPANLPDKALDDEATRKIILEVIDNLPDGQRACVILYYYTQNTISQIADMIETNESTVKSRLALARAKIRAALEYKAEKEGIKLWGIPLALTPILREAFEQFVMPEDADAHIRDFISKATAESMNTGDSPGADTSGNSGTSGRIGPKSGTGGATATKTIVKAVISMSTKKIITTVVIVLISAAVITAGVIFLPPLFSSPDPANTPGVSDTQTPGTTTPDNTPGATDTTPDTSETPPIPDIPEAPASDFEYETIADGIVIMKYVGNSAEVRIPRSINGKPVVEIGKQAFLFNESLTTVIIPENVTTINQDAFNGCKSLTSLTIPDSVKTIGVMAFNNCNLLTILTIPNSVTKIGDWAFSNCISLTSVTINATASFGQDVFNECGSLKNVTFGDGVTKIDKNAFKDFTSLISVTIPDSVTEIGDSAFSGSGINNITIPESVTSMGDNVFMGCTLLESVTLNGALPDNPQSNHQFFNECSSLTSVTIGDSVTTIPDYIFNNLGALKTVKLGNNVTSIGGRAFKGCTSLESIHIPDSVTHFGEFVFEGCVSLYSVNIPKSMTHIGDRAFMGCGLTSLTIPDNVTSIGVGTFTDCRSLKNVVIPDSVTTIEKGDYSNGLNRSAFDGIPGLTATYKGKTYTAIQSSTGQSLMPDEFYDAINNG